MAGIVVGNQQGVVGRNMRVGLSVLVVDDDPSALLIAERMLTTKQYNVTTASGGGEALRLLKISDGQFDLILSDLYMPSMNGFQLLQVVRAVYNIPFLFMSSDHRLDVMERGLEAGARFFFPKPLTIMDYENIWQFVYIENIEYFHWINIEGHEGPPPPPLAPPSPLQDMRPNSLSLSDDICTLGRSSSSSSNTSKGKKRRQDEDHNNKKQKRPYKKRERKEDQDFDKKTSVVPIKNKRVVWTTQLHEKFLQALRILKMARKRAVPKRIHALMKVRGLNRENIASHLQKYRLYQNKYKGTSESDYPRRRIRMRLPDETEYHDYSPSRDHSYDYQNRAQSSLRLANQSRLRVKDNFRPPHNFNHVPVARPQYHSQEGSNDNFMAQANHGPTAVTNMGYHQRPWMSGAPTMNQSNVGAYQSLYGTSAPLYGNDLNIGSSTNAIPIMAEQQIPQCMQGFLPNAPIDPNFGNLSFENPQNSSPSVDTDNIAPFGVGNGILTGTIGGEIPNEDKVADISRMDEICKGNKPIEEAEDESFVVNPNYATVGESSTGALVNPNNSQQGNEVNNNGWLNSVNDIADFLFNQASENANEEEGGGYKNPTFDPWWFLQDGDNNNPGAI